MSGERKRISRVQPAAPKLGFHVLALSRDPAIVALAAEAMPHAVDLRAVSSREEVHLELRSYDVPCGAIADLDLGARELDELLKLTRSRWVELPTLVVLRSSSPASLAAAEQLSRSMAFKQSSPTKLLSEMAQYFGDAFGARARHAAKVMAYARQSRLEAAQQELLLAYAVRLVPRAELAGFLAISESAVSKRITALCDQLGVRTIGEVAQLLLPLSGLDVDPEILSELEAG